MTDTEFQVKTGHHWKAFADTGIQVYRTARITARAMFREHPYALLFLLIFGGFLFPLSSTAIVGTLAVVALSGATILISTVVFAPTLFILAILAFLTWCASILVLCLYRYKWAATEHEMTMSRQRSARWSAFKSTLGSSKSIAMEGFSPSGLGRHYPGTGPVPIDTSTPMATPVGSRGMVSIVEEPEPEEPTESVEAAAEPLAFEASLPTPLSPALPDSPEFTPRLP